MSEERQPPELHEPIARFRGLRSPGGFDFHAVHRGSTTFSSTLQVEINAGRIVLESIRVGP